MRRSLRRGRVLEILVALSLLSSGCASTPPAAGPTSTPAGLVTVAPGRSGPSATPARAEGPVGSASTSPRPDAAASPAADAHAGSPPERPASPAADGRFKTAIASDSTFQVEAPGRMAEEVQTLSGGARMHHLHTDKKGDVVYDVAWVELDPRVASLPASQLLDATARSMTQSAPGVKAATRVLKGSPELENIVVEQPGPDHVVLVHCILVAQGRLYQLTVTPRAGKRAEAADTDRFLDSFTLLNAPKATGAP